MKTSECSSARPFLFRWSTGPQWSGTRRSWELPKPKASRSCSLSSTTPSLSGVWPRGDGSTPPPLLTSPTLLRKRMHAPLKPGRFYSSELPVARRGVLSCLPPLGVVEGRKLSAEGLTNEGIGAFLASLLALTTRSPCSRLPGVRWGSTAPHLPRHPSGIPSTGMERRPDPCRLREAWIPEALGVRPTHPPTFWGGLGLQQQWPHFSGALLGDGQ